MNLAEYTKALTYAESHAVEFKTPYVVTLWTFDNSVTASSLSVFTVLEGSLDSERKIIASVDQDGFITESAWVKKQMEVAA